MKDDGTKYWDEIQENKTHHHHLHHQMEEKMEVYEVVVSQILQSYQYTLIILSLNSQTSPKGYYIFL